MLLMSLQICPSIIKLGIETGNSCSKTKLSVIFKEIDLKNIAKYFSGNDNFAVDSLQNCGIILIALPRWRNWQTHSVEGAAGNYRLCGFESHSRHHLKIKPPAFPGRRFFVFGRRFYRWDFNILLYLFSLSVYLCRTIIQRITAYCYCCLI